MDDQALGKAIAGELAALEAEEEIVVCTASPSRVVERLRHAVLGVVPQTGLTPAELYGVRNLILQAIHTPSFFDWEMPTLTGFSADQFQAIADKLPRE